LDLFLVVTVAATAKFSEIFDVIIRLVSVLNHVSDISISFHIIVVIAIIIHVSTLAAIILDDGLLELELVLQTDLTQASDQ